MSEDQELLRLLQQIEANVRQLRLDQVKLRIMEARELSRARTLDSIRQQQQSSDTEDSHTKADDATPASVGRRRGGPGGREGPSVVHMTRLEALVLLAAQADEIGNPDVDIVTITMIANGKILHQIVTVRTAGWRRLVLPDEVIDVMNRVSDACEPATDVIARIVRNMGKP